LDDCVKHITISDNKDNLLTGEKHYRLLISPALIAVNFWSVLVYDSDTDLIIVNSMPWPSIFSNKKELEVNQDGSVYIWFGPEAPIGKENNWIQTIKGKGWTMILRLYGRFESGIEQTWRPGNLELIENFKDSL